MISCCSRCFSCVSVVSNMVVGGSCVVHSWFIVVWFEVVWVGSVYCGAFVARRQFSLLQLWFVRGGAALVLSWFTVDSNVVQLLVEGLYVIQVWFRFGSALVEHCVD